MVTQLVLVPTVTNCIVPDWLKTQHTILSGLGLWPAIFGDILNNKSSGMRMKEHSLVGIQDVSLCQYQDSLHLGWEWRNTAWLGYKMYLYANTRILYIWDENEGTQPGWDTRCISMPIQDVSLCQYQDSVRITSGMRMKEKRGSHICISHREYPPRGFITSGMRMKEHSLVGMQDVSLCQYQDSLHLGWEWRNTAWLGYRMYLYANTRIHYIWDENEGTQPGWDTRCISMPIPGFITCCHALCYKCEVILFHIS